MYKKILVPLDGSSIGECVLSHVQAIATGCSVPEVDLLYVVDSLGSKAFAYDPDTMTPVVEIEKESLDKAEAQGKDYLGKLAAGLKADGVAVKSVVLRGRPAEEILDYTEKNGIDLIIMSTHGRSGPARWAMGSVADKIVRLSKAAVMVVRHPSCTIAV
ncbi:MAG: universal stress protein [Chloroflexota bacterium]